MNAVAENNLSTTAASTVYVIEDDAPTRDAVTELLSSTGARVRGFPNAEQFLAEFTPNGPACLVVDEQLPGMNGSDLLQSLARDRVQSPSVLVSGHATVPLAVSAMRSGAITVLEKPCADASLVEAVRQALQQDAARIERQRPQQDAKQRLSDLSDSEREVLQMVLDGTPNKQIASRLGVCVRTVESRRSKIYTAAQVKSVAELVRLCIAAGVVDN